jgi:hypothetical protein
MRSADPASGSCRAVEHSDALSGIPCAINNHNCIRSEERIVCYFQVQEETRSEGIYV